MKQPNVRKQYYSAVCISDVLYDDVLYNDVLYNDVLYNDKLAGGGIDMWYVCVCVYMRVVLLGHQACILGHGVKCTLLVAEQFTGGIVLNDTTSIQHDDTGGEGDGESIFTTCGSIHRYQTVNSIPSALP